MRFYLARWCILVVFFPLMCFPRGSQLTLDLYCLCSCCPFPVFPFSRGMIFPVLILDFDLSVYVCCPCFVSFSFVLWRLFMLSLYPVDSDFLSVFAAPVFPRSRFPFGAYVFSLVCCPRSFLFCLLLFFGDRVSPVMPDFRRQQ